MRAFAIIIALSIALAGASALAQSIGGMSGLGIVVSKGSGGGGGGGGAACVQNLQLDFSNACNLIGQMTGN